MLHIIWYIIVGFIVGLIARAIMPGAPRFHNDHAAWDRWLNCWRTDRPVVFQTGAGLGVSSGRFNHVDHRRDYFAIYLDKTGGLTNVIGLVGPVQIAGQTLRVYPALDVRPPGVRVVSPR